MFNSFRFFPVLISAIFFGLPNLSFADKSIDQRKNEKEFMARARQAREDLEKMFEEENQLRAQPGSGWDS